MLKNVKIMTNLEKAKAVLNAENRADTQIIGDMLYIKITDELAVAVHDRNINYLASRYEEVNL